MREFHTKTDVWPVDGLDVDLTLGFVWYEWNESFVVQTKNEVLRTGAKSSC